MFRTYSRQGYSAFLQNLKQVLKKQTTQHTPTRRACSSFTKYIFQGLHQIKATEVLYCHVTLTVVKHLSPHTPLPPPCSYHHPFCHFYVCFSCNNLTVCSPGDFSLNTVVLHCTCPSMKWIPEKKKNLSWYNSSLAVWSTAPGCTHLKALCAVLLSFLTFCQIR